MPFKPEQTLRPSTIANPLVNNGTNGTKTSKSTSSGQNVSSLKLNDSMSPDQRELVLAVSRIIKVFKRDFFEVSDSSSHPPSALVFATSSFISSNAIFICFPYNPLFFPYTRLYPTDLALRRADISIIN